VKPRDERQGYKIDPRGEGRFINLKIQSKKFWKLSFLGLDMKPTSRR
jgi:hypothetical protein